VWYRGDHQWHIELYGDLSDGSELKGRVRRQQSDVC
jgi:hypothetical protein